MYYSIALTKLNLTDILIVNNKKEQFWVAVSSPYPWPLVTLTQAGHWLSVTSRLPPVGQPSSSSCYVIPTRALWRIYDLGSPGLMKTIWPRVSKPYEGYITQELQALWRFSEGHGQGFPGLMKALWNDKNRGLKALWRFTEGCDPGAPV